MRKSYTSFLLIISLLLSIRSNAQDGSNDPTFNPGDVGFGKGDGPNIEIKATSIQVDGKIIIVGSFTTYNDTLRNHIARLNTN